jgi:hypothetical protein
MRISLCVTYREQFIESLGSYWVTGSPLSPANGRSRCVPDPGKIKICSVVLFSAGGSTWPISTSPNPIYSTTPTMPLPQMRSLLRSLKSSPVRLRLPTIRIQPCLRVESTGRWSAVARREFASAKKRASETEVGGSAPREIAYRHWRRQIASASSTSRGLRAITVR